MTLGLTLTQNYIEKNDVPSLQGMEICSTSKVTFVFSKEKGRPTVCALGDRSSKKWQNNIRPAYPYFL